MKEAEVFYGSTPHPANSKVWGEIYKNIHFGNSSSIVSIKRWVFDKYYQKLPYTFDQGFEEIYQVLNGYGDTANPLATEDGQNWLIKNKVRHTSMSIGDMIKRNGVFHIVARRGFRKVKFVKGEDCKK